MGKLTFWFLFCCLIFFLGSCSYHPILKGEFEAEAPQNFVGVGKELHEGGGVDYVGGDGFLAMAACGEAEQADEEGYVAEGAGFHGVFFAVWIFAAGKGEGCTAL